MRALSYVTRVVLDRPSDSRTRYSKAQLRVGVWPRRNGPGTRRRRCLQTHNRRLAEIEGMPISAPGPRSRVLVQQIARVMKVQRARPPGERTQLLSHRLGVSHDNKRGLLLGMQHTLGRRIMRTGGAHYSISRGSRRPGSPLDSPLLWTRCASAVAAEECDRSAREMHWLIS